MPCKADSLFTFWLLKRMNNMQVHWSRRSSMNQCVVATMKFVHLLYFQASPVRPVYHVLKQCDGKWVLDLCFIFEHCVATRAIVITEANVIQFRINPIQSPRKVICSRSGEVEIKTRVGREKIQPLSQQRGNRYVRPFFMFYIYKKMYFWKRK